MNCGNYDVLLAPHPSTDYKYQMTIGIVAVLHDYATEEPMLPHDVQQDPPSPARLLEMLVDRFGIFEAAASASITLARLDETGEVELPMEKAVAEAVMEFGSDLRSAFHAARALRQESGHEPDRISARPAHRRQDSRPPPTASDTVSVCQQAS